MAAQRAWIGLERESRRESVSIHLCECVERLFYQRGKPGHSRVCDGDIDGSKGSYGLNERLLIAHVHARRLYLPN